MREMNKRFKALKGRITEMIVTRDVFGMRKRLTTNAEIQPGQYRFSTSSEKVAGFMSWLQDEIDQNVLEIVEGPIQPAAGYPEWQTKYITSAYQKGMAQAYGILKKGGVLSAGAAAFDPTFLSPFHVDRVGLLYVRNFEELKGITAKMSQEIARELARGMAEGRGPRYIASQINKKVEGVGLARARIMARTEIVRAHHKATIGIYKQAGILGIKVMAEWLTAGDDRVCSLCQPLEGEIFPIEKAEEMLPLHPQCRCTTVPVTENIPASDGTTLEEAEARYEDVPEGSFE